MRYSTTALTALCVALSLPAAQAQTVPQGAAVLEVLDGGQKANGHVQLGLRLSLSEGWKTYWRAPGDAGVPPLFDWSGSDNLHSVQVTWPVPIVFEQNGMRSVGYSGQVVLPLELTPVSASEPVHLRGNVQIGICEEVCLPAAFDIDHVIDRQAQKHPAISVALAQRPFSAAEAGVSDIQCEITSDGQDQLLRAEITMDQLGPDEQAVVETGLSGLWASEPEVERNGTQLIIWSRLVQIDDTNRQADPDRLRFTILEAAQAVDIQGCNAG